MPQKFKDSKEEVGPTKIKFYKISPMKIPSAPTRRGRKIDQVSYKTLRQQRSGLGDMKL